MKILLIDNYDSFTYNLFQLISEISSAEVKVIRNDEMEIQEVNNYEKIILSPGPGLPSEAGIMNEVIKKYYSKKSIFGVCLGMQGIAEVFGGELFNLDKPLHGVTSKCKHIGTKLFKNIPNEFKIGHYHSWAVNEIGLSDNFNISARSEDNLVMAIEHKVFDVVGVQFHPESILTDYGKVLMKNFLQK